MRYFVACLLVLGFAASAYAAPVGLTSEADATIGELWADNNMALSVGFVADFVNDRNIDIDSGEFEMEAYTCRLGLSVLDRLNFYVDLGQMQNAEYAYVLLGEKFETKFDDEFLWGIGLNALAYRWDNGLEIGLAGSYRQADMIIENSTIDGTLYEGTSMASKVEGEFTEYQAAVELAWRTEYFVPYVGIKYSDVEVDANFNLGLQDKNASGKNADLNVGVFVGLTITPKLANMPKSEHLAINLEGRFLDEEAVNVGVSYKF